MTIKILQSDVCLQVFICIFRAEKAIKIVLQMDPKFRQNQVGAKKFCKGLNKSHVFFLFSKILLLSGSSLKKVFGIEQTLNVNVFIMAYNLICSPTSCCRKPCELLS